MKLTALSVLCAVVAMVMILSLFNDNDNRSRNDKPTASGPARLETIRQVREIYCNPGKDCAARVAALMRLRDVLPGFVPDNVCGNGANK